MKWDILIFLWILRKQVCDEKISEIKYLNSDAFTGEFYQKFKDLILISTQSFLENRRGRTFLNSTY